VQRCTSFFAENFPAERIVARVTCTRLWPGQLDLIAATWPARRAARLDILAAMPPSDDAALAAKPQRTGADPLVR
jgi:ABC-type lipoprotein release transport system permease subunit